MTTKMPAKKFVIAVDVVTTAPLHITAIEKGSYDPETKRLYRYDAKAIGCSLTRTQKIASAAFVRGDDLITPEVPVIPASTVAGKLRRSAADLIFASIVARDMTISVDAYNTMTTGMPSTELKADSAGPETVRAARRDPFLSLFGGTSFALSAGSVISAGLPLLEMTAPMLMTEPLVPLQPFSDLRDMTEAVAIVRKNDAMEMTGTHLEGVVGLDALVSYASQEGDRRADSKSKKSSGEDGKKTDLRTLNAFEAVRTGMNFALRVEVTSRSPAHLGLMLLSVQKLLQDGQFGGKGARGMGRFNAVASRLYSLDPSNRELAVMTNLFQGRQTGYAFHDSAMLDEAVTSAQDYIDSVNPLLLDAFASADAKKIKELTSGVA